MSDQETTRLALAAVDEAFQEHVKRLFSVMVGATQGDTENGTALARAMRGLASGRETRATLRKAIE